MHKFRGFVAAPVLSGQLSLFWSRVKLAWLNALLRWQTREWRPIEVFKDHLQIRRYEQVFNRTHEGPPQEVQVSRTLPQRLLHMSKAVILGIVFAVVGVAILACAFLYAIAPEFFPAVYGRKIGRPIDFWWWLWDGFLGIAMTGLGSLVALMAILFFVFWGIGTGIRKLEKRTSKWIPPVFTDLYHWRRTRKAWRRWVRGYRGIEEYWENHSPDEQRASFDDGQLQAVFESAHRIRPKSWLRSFRITVWLLYLKPLRFEERSVGPGILIAEIERTQRVVETNANVWRNLEAFRWVAQRLERLIVKDNVFNPELEKSFYELVSAIREELSLLSYLPIVHDLPDQLADMNLIAERVTPIVQAKRHDLELRKQFTVGERYLEDLGLDDAPVIFPRSSA